jgi:hypothetical protein
VPITGNMDSAARVGRRQKRKLNDDVVVERSSSGRKPRQITVQSGGEIDGACLGKITWDDAVRGLVPRILDLSVVEWEGQKPEAVQKLWNKLDAEFEYIGNPLSMQGFQKCCEALFEVRTIEIEDAVSVGEYNKLGARTTCPVGET